MLKTNIGSRGAEYSILELCLPRAYGLGVNFSGTRKWKYEKALTTKCATIIETFGKYKVSGMYLEMSARGCMSSQAPFLSLFFFCVWICFVVIYNGHG